jgi:hypothetical protein
VWNVVVFSELGSIERLASGRWTSDEDFNWIQASELVELFV